MASKRSIPIDAIVPGGFYQGVFPGGFTDVVTNIHIPGPIVELDKSTKRQVVKVTEMPAPVQIPHLKRIKEFKDKDRKAHETRDVPFDRQDEQPLHEALVLALNTGNIRYVPDEEVQARHPETWAARQQQYIFDPEGKPARQMTDLIEDYYEQAEQGAAASNARAEELQQGQADADSALTGGSGAPPPPPKK